MSNNSFYATLSKDRVYRYTWGVAFHDFEGAQRQSCIFLMLNPSTADENKTDPTVRRCMGFARQWGFASLSVINIFAYRATNPKELRFVNDPIGDWNDIIIKRTADKAPMVVCAWGTHGGLRGRGKQVLEMLEPYNEKLFHFGWTKNGQPRHPLYVPANTPLISIKRGE